VGAAWISSTAFCAPTVRTVLDLDDAWVPAGMVAVGWPAGPSPAPRPRIAADDFLLEM
jgi:coenzyme F420-0:L-glutamate ligase/coenzyme F420-1:gamma-L-glutamate ligase